MKSRLIQEHLDTLQSNAAKLNHTSFLDKYLNFLESTNQGANADQLIKDASLDTIRAFNDGLIESHKISVVVQIFTVLRSFYSHLAERSIVEASPFPVRPGESKDRWFYLKEDQIQLLAETQDKEIFTGCRNRSIIWLLCGCGITVKELVELELKDIKDKTVQIGKGRMARTVPIIESALLPLESCLKSYLEKYYKTHVELPSKVLLVNDDNVWLLSKDIWMMLRESYLMAGMFYPIVPNDFRRSFAKHLIDSGISAESLQKLLDLNSIAYARKWIDHLK